MNYKLMVYQQNLLQKGQRNINVFSICLVRIGRDDIEIFDRRSHLFSTGFSVEIRYCLIEKVDIYLRFYSWKQAKKVGYKIQISKVISKRIAECILKSPFSATKCVIIQKIQKLRRKNCAKFLGKITANKRVKDKKS